MRIKNIIFDLDGTLLDTLEDLAASLNVALAAFGFKEKSISEVKDMVGRGAKLLVEQALPADIDQQTLENCLAYFRKHYAKNICVHTKPYDGIMELLGVLHEKKIVMAVVSNKPDAAVKNLCNIFFKGYLSVATGEVEGVPKKPAPDSVFGAMRSMGAEKEDTLYVGDSDIDMLTAKNAGLRGVGVTWGFCARDKIIAAGADYLIEKAEELPAIFGKM